MKTQAYCKENILASVAEDVKNEYWYAHGKTTLGGSDYWRPLSMRHDGKGVLGQTCNFGDKMEIDADEYMEMRTRPLKKIGMWDFRPPTDPIADLRFANQHPTAAGCRIASLNEENRRLRDLLKNVISGDWCVTDIQEALGDL